MKLTPRDQIIVAALLIVLAAVAAVFLVIMPEVTRIAKLDADIAAADQEISAAQALLNQRQDAKLQAASTQARLIMLANELPDAPELPSLIIELQDTANQSGIEFTRIQPETPSPGTGYSELGLTLNVAGRWTDIIEFTRRLTGLTRQIRVSNVTLNPAQDPAAASSDAPQDSEAAEEGPILVNASVRIEAYMLDASASSSSSVPPPPGGTTSPAPAGGAAAAPAVR